MFKIVHHMRGWSRALLSAGLVAVTVVGGAMQASAQNHAAQARARAATTIHVWQTFSLAENRLFATFISEYEKSHPGVRVDVYNIPYSQRTTKVPTAVQTGTLPDILRADYPYQFYLAALHKALPLNSYLKGWSGLTDFPSWTWTYATYHGQLVDIPQDYWPRALYYNKTLFKKAGIAGPPKTWSELLSDAKKLTGHGTAGFGVVGASPDGYFTYALLLALEGGSIFKNDTDISPKTVTLDSPQAKTAMTLYGQLGDSHVLQADPTSTTYNDIVAAFQSGKVAMYIDGSWAIANYAVVAPHLDYGVAPLPALPGAKYKAFADYSFYTVPSSTANAKQDINLLEWLLSPRNTLRWATELGHIPPLRTSNLDSPTMKRYLSDHPQFKAFVLPERDFAPTASIDPQVPYAIPIQDAVAKQLQEYLLGRLKASQVLSAMQKNVQSVVSQNQ